MIQRSEPAWQSPVVKLCVALRFVIWLKVSDPGLAQSGFKQNVAYETEPSDWSDCQTGGSYVLVVVVVVLGAASRSNCTGITPRFAGQLLDPSALIGGPTAVWYVNPDVTTDEVVNVCAGWKYQVPVVVAATAAPAPPTNVKNRATIISFLISVSFVPRVVFPPTGKPQKKAEQSQRSGFSQGDAIWTRGAESIHREVGFCVSNDRALPLIFVQE